jgi:hypothetical protein
MIYTWCLYRLHSWPQTPPNRPTRYLDIHIRTDVHTSFAVCSMPGITARLVQLAPSKLYQAKADDRSYAAGSVTRLLTLVEC